MNLDEWEHIIGIGTGIWFVWFIIEFLAIDYNSLCFEEFGNNTLCFNEAFLILPDFMYDLSEKISLLILGFFVFDLGYRCGKIGLNGFIHDRQNGREVLLDVAHNPAAATLLAQRLLQLKQRRNGKGKFIAVLAMMADKDTKGFCQALKSVVDLWYIAQVDIQRSMSAEKLADSLNSVSDEIDCQVFESTKLAYLQACSLAQSEDLILITGSFFTVASIRKIALGLS